MRNLTAMLKFDLLNLRGMGIGALILLVLGVVFTAMGGAAGTPMLAILMMLLGHQNFSLDSIGTLPLLYHAVPTTRRTVMTSHYLVAAGALVVGTVAVLGATAFTHAIQPSLGSREVMLGTTLTVLAMALVLAIQIPFTVRYGQRGIIAMLLVVGVLGFGGGFLFMQLQERGTTMLEAFGTWVWRNPVPTVLGLVAIVIGAWVVSYFASLRVFLRKDF